MKGSTGEAIKRGNPRKARRSAQRACGGLVRERTNRLSEVDKGKSNSHAVFSRRVFLRLEGSPAWKKGGKGR